MKGEKRKRRDKREKRQRIARKGKEGILGKIDELLPSEILSDVIITTEKYDQI